MSSSNPYASPQSSASAFRRPTGRFVSAHSRAVATMVLVGTVAVLRLLQVGLRASQIYAVQGLQPGLSAPQWLQGVDVASNLVLLGGALVMLLSGVVFCAWFYRAYVNLPALGNRKTNYSPGWTIGSWFIPIGNLVIPYQLMIEILQGSFPPTGGNAPRRPIPGLWWARSWWALWLAMIVGDRALTFLPESSDLPSLVRMLWCASAVDLVAAAGGVLLVLTVRQADLGQAQRRRQLDEQPPAPEPPQSDQLLEWLSAAQGDGPAR